MLNTEFKLHLLTVGDHLTKGKLILRDNHLIVYCKGTEPILVPYEWVSEIQFEDKSTDELSGAGFGLDYQDDYGAGRLTFYEAGWGSVRKIKNAVDAICKAHSAHYANTSVPALNVTNLNVIKALASQSVVHRGY